MLPGEAPPGRGVPGRGAPGPGRGACGRGIGLSTGCAEENGLLPTRGGRGSPGLGATGPGRGPGAAGLAAGATGATGAAVAAGGGAGAAGAAGTGAAGALGCATGGAATAAPSEGAAAGFAVAFTAAFSAAFGGAFSVVLPPPNPSRNRRATGASTVDDADLTNSPCSLRRARTSLLVTPSSFANSCTRALPATTSPFLEASGLGEPRLGFSYDTWSSGLHGVLMFFATCSLPRVSEPGEMLDHRGHVRCTGDAQRSTEGSPPDRCRQATIFGVQPSPPARM